MTRVWPSSSDQKKGERDKIFLRHHCIVQYCSCKFRPAESMVRSISILFMVCDVKSAPFGFWETASQAISFIPSTTHNTRLLGSQNADKKNVGTLGVKPRGRHYRDTKTGHISSPLSSQEEEKLTEREREGGRSSSSPV